MFILDLMTPTDFKQVQMAGGGFCVFCLEIILLLHSNYFRIGVVKVSGMKAAVCLC